jgi:hypothetical protein
MACYAGLVVRLRAGATEPSANRRRSVSASIHIHLDAAPMTATPFGARTRAESLHQDYAKEAA